MIEAAFAQLSFATSIAFGKPFLTRMLYQLINALRETQREFGSLCAEGAELLSGPVLDEETRQQMQLSRFKKVAKIAARETPYYRQLFEELKLDPAHWNFSDISRLPLTSKEAVRENPDAFVRQNAKPFMRALTTGTTGRPTSICFSQHELQVFSALSAISNLHSKDIEEGDIVQISTSARGTLGNLSLAGACALVGAQTYLAGVIDPAHALAMLSEKRYLKGSRQRTSILYTYPSYLGELVETGLRLGYRPSDFGLKHIIVGGELVSEGLKRRCQQLFGETPCLEGYGMTEIWPVSGMICSQAHLHFEPSQGLIEIYNPTTENEAKMGEAGNLVVTPFLPYRETTLLLRYDTADVVKVLEETPVCELRGLPATSLLQGKRSLSVYSEVTGWVYPRQVMEALEALEEVPLPARFGFWTTKDARGVVVEVVVRKITAQVYGRVRRSLEDAGVPVTKLCLLEERSQLRQPYPLRGDLREYSFPVPAQPLELALEI